jgi:hypothetical protein
MGVRAVLVPVPITVGHDLACLLWNLSATGGQRINFIPPFYYKHAYMLFAMGVFGGCPCAGFATDALQGGGCLCAHALLRYL